MSFASLRRILRTARKGLCSTCSKTKYPQLEAAGAGHVGCLIYTFETLGQLVKDDHSVTALHVAARKGQISILIYLVENDLIDSIPRAKNGASPAHDAAGCGQLECLRYILKSTKANANDVDVNNATPLHWAVQSGRFDVIRWLIADAHASVDAVTKAGSTPIHIAAAKCQMQALRWMTGYIYQHYPKPRRLMNSKDKNGFTPIYHAALAGHVEIIKWLAEKGGGDPTVLSSHGLAPLHAATINNRDEAVKYLFQFGSASAPGGLRTTEGAAALHFAAAEGHASLISWFLSQKECSGKERDYYQSTPMHDAAERGQLKAIQVLCEHSVDHNLVDIEGNTPRDLAEKNGRTKCVKYLEAVEKQRLNGITMSGGERPKGLTRQKHTSAEMTDSYRNAPPHQRPVDIFEAEEDSVNAQQGRHWETLHDLMDEKEIDQLEVSSPGDKQKSAHISAAEEKRLIFEEKLRKEEEIRMRKKQELLKREREVEQEIRERLLAEQSQLSSQKKEVIPPGKRGVTGKDVNKKTRPSALDPSRRHSSPQTDTDNRLGAAEKQTESRYPNEEKGSKKFLSKFLRKSISVPSHLYNKSSSEDDEDRIPEPPPPPTVEYLLGKRPQKLRKVEAVSTAEEEMVSHSSESTKRKKRSKHRRKNKDESVEWQYSKITSSPPRVRKTLERKPTPIPSLQSHGFESLPSPQKLEFTSGKRQRKLTPAPKNIQPDPSLLIVPKNFGQNEETSSISSLSPLNSPSPKSPITPSALSPSSSFDSPTKPLPANNKSSHSLKPKRAAPAPPSQVRASPVTRIGNTRKQTKNTPEHPMNFASELQKALNGADLQPKFKQQQNGTGKPTSPHLLTLSDDAFTFLEEFSQRPPSPKGHVQEDSQSSDSSDSSFTSSSDDSTSDSSSEDEMQATASSTRPVMAKNRALQKPRTFPGFSRNRMLARYPRLLRKRVVRLSTIKEAAEEAIYGESSPDEQANVFYRLKAEMRCIKAWRKYIQTMKIVYRKAEKMAQRKRRELFAKVFYAWIQVRNIQSVEITTEQAQLYYKQRLLNITFDAWLSHNRLTHITRPRSGSKQTQDVEETYLMWLNEQLSRSGKAAKDISDSLASGVLIIQAVANASGKKAPKCNQSPKILLHRQDNWKVAHNFMTSVGINVRNIEPADLAKLLPAAIHNMFNSILKWQSDY